MSQAVLVCAQVKDKAKRGASRTPTYGERALEVLTQKCAIRNNRSLEWDVAKIDRLIVNVFDDDFFILLLARAGRRRC